MDSFFESNDYLMESFERPYTISQDEGDLTEDPLSGIHVDPSIYVGLFHDVGDIGSSGPFHAQYEFTSEAANQYNEDFVQRRVAESAYAEPWSGLSSQSVYFSSTSTLSQTIIASQPNLTSDQVDVSDSGYNSLPCKPLVCPQCGKAFKNKAEEKKHSSTHSRPFKCRIENCTNLKGFATSNDLERHQKDIHLIRPKHGPQAYYRCVLPTCSKREKMWTRKDNFKAHMTRMHKNMGIDIDHLIGSAFRSEMMPTAAELDQLARAKNAQIHNKNKGKQRANNQSKQAMMPEHNDTSSEPDTAQAAIPLWQTNVPDYLDDVPQEAAEMVTAYNTRRVANTNVPNVVLKNPNGIPANLYGYNGPNSRHDSADGAWDEMSDTSFAYSHESSAFGGGTSDFG